MILLEPDVLFVEIPRTGTDTIRLSLLGETIDQEPRHISLSEYLVRHPEHLAHARCTIVRNPFERVASLYEHSRHFHPEKYEFQSFEKFVNWYTDPVSESLTRDDIRKTQVQMLSINGEINMDYIGRFEQYEKTVENFIVMFNLQKKGQLTNTNSFKKLPYRDYYTRKTKKKIEAFVGEDLQLFKYSF